MTKRTSKGNRCLETFAKLQQTNEDVFAQIFQRLKYFRKEENRLDMNHEAKCPQLQEPIKMTSESGILCTQIVG